MTPRPPRVSHVPPTLGYLKQRGVKTIRVWCNRYQCAHHATVQLDAVARPDNTALPSLKFQCSKCGERDTSTQADLPA